MNKRIVILGAGESGIGAAILARSKGFDVFISDSGKVAPKFKAFILEEGFEWEEGEHTLAKILHADEVIKSPGIPDKSAVIKSILNENIPIISEIEFAARYTTAKKICITGSNGKTTTALLTYHILKNAGLNVGLAGNIGHSFARLVATENYDYYVLEISSFQLDNIKNFRAEIAVLTNITPDHLDRYEYDLQRYAASKFRILLNQKKEDAFIYCMDDEETQKGLKNREIIAKQYPFTIKGQLNEGAWLDKNQLIIHILNQPLTMSIQELALQGNHNVYNSMAAAIAAKLTGIRKDSIRESLADFKNAEHRMESVAKVNGIEFINDSKATNVNSTWYALESFDGPIIWIAGGVDKGNDYDMLKEIVAQKVKALICLGTDNQKLMDAFKSIVPVVEVANSAEEAVSKAYRIGKKGDTVLLSPACASFDLFENYEDRGQQFKSSVRAL